MAVGAVAVVLQGIADGVRAVPEGGVEDGDVFVDEGLLVAVEQGGDFGDHLGAVWRQVHESELYSKEGE